MLDSLVQGLELVVAWPAIGYMLLGVVVGIWLGAVPGLSGAVGMVIALPFTFGMDPVSAFALLLGIFAVTSTGDTISSVLLGVPGTAGSQATILDGYPMAQRGEATRAFGAAFTVSMIGGVLGGLLLAVSLPVIRPVILAFGSPEFFMISILGLTMVGAVSGASILKGLAGACLGLVASMVGYAAISPIPRFWFGQTYLLDGLPLIPIVLGLFGIPELLDLAVRQTNIARVPEASRRGMMQGVRDAFRHWWLVLRCSAIGVYIGMLPGLGSSISDWVAYGHAVQSARDKSQFGKGDVRGVIAPEAANNAVRGGSMIPTVAFGIPGSAALAILLTALLIQGLRPGQQMLVQNLHITFSMVWTIILANIVAALLLMMFSRQIAKLAFVEGNLLLPGIFMLLLMGAWVERASMGDWVVLLGSGALGVLMKRGGWPRPPLILAFVLGPLIESNYHLSTRAYGDTAWLLRPFVVVILILIVLTLVFAGRRTLKSRVTSGPASQEGRGDDTERNPLVSVLIAALLLGVAVTAAITALDWRPSVRRFPLLATIPMAAMLAVVLWNDLRTAHRTIGEAGGFGPAVEASARQAMLGRTTSFLAWLVGTAVLGVFVHQIVAIAAFALGYLMVWARKGLLLSAGYAGGVAVFLYLFYDRLLHVRWQTPVIQLW